MKYDITGSVCLCANTLDMDSSGSKHSQGDELNLEELIKCVSLGKTAVDPASGKYDLSKNLEKSTTVKEAKKPSDSNFNPLTLVLSVKDISKSNKQLDEEQHVMKKCRQMTPDKEASTNGKKLVEIQKTDANAEICSAERLKRKRHLHDTDSFCLNKINDKANLKKEPATSITTVNEKYTELTANLATCSDDSVVLQELHDSTGDTLEKVSVSKSGTLPNIEQLSLKENRDKLVPSAIASCDSSQAIECTAVSVEQPDALSNTIQQKKSRKRNLVSNTNDSEPRSLRKRIRKTLPPLKTRQTPLGLPKPLRLKKDKFSVEEIYTNKNYSTPVPKQLETIFEYPKEEKDGSVRFSETRRKQRAMVFYTNPADRPTKKKRPKYKKRSTRRSKRDNDATADTKLIQKLAELDQHMLMHDLSP